MSEQNKQEFDPSEISFILSVEDAVNYVRENGYLKISQQKIENLNNADLWHERIEKEGLKIGNGSIATGVEGNVTIENLIYNPNKIEQKVIAIKNGINWNDEYLKLKTEGWEEIGEDRGGDYAVLIKRIKTKEEK